MLSFGTVALLTLTPWAALQQIRKKPRQVQLFVDGPAIFAYFSK